MALNREKFLDPSAAVLAQDDFMIGGRIDLNRWISTVFFPLTLVSEDKTFVISDRKGLANHLEVLETKAQELGVVRLRTRILSHIQPGDDIAILSSIRERLDAKDVTVGLSSITWSVIRIGSGWKINQIHFNDSRLDPSVVAQAFLGWPNKSMRHAGA